MNPSETKTSEQLPETGEHSAPGARWFVSCRFPNLVVTIVAPEDKTPTSPAVRGVSAIFNALAKPNSLQASGGASRRERGNWDGTDTNNSGKWGVFGPIIDPGPEPEGGYKDGVVEWIDKDGEKDETRRERLSAEKKAFNRKILDQLRGMTRRGFYRTPQTNEVSYDSVLVEITWDPIPQSGRIAGVVTRGRKSIGRNGETSNQEGGTMAAAAPAAGSESPGERNAPATSAVRAPKLGRR